MREAMVSSFLLGEGRWGVGLAQDEIRNEHWSVDGGRGETSRSYFSVGRGGELGVTYTPSKSIIGQNSSRRCPRRDERGEEGGEGREQGAEGFPRRT